MDVIVVFVDFLHVFAFMFFIRSSIHIFFFSDTKLETFLADYLDMEQVVEKNMQSKLQW